MYRSDINSFFSSLLGRNSSIGKSFEELLYFKLQSDNIHINNKFKNWFDAFNAFFNFDGLPQKIESDLFINNQNVREVSTAERIFLIQTYYSLVIKCLTAIFIWNNNRSNLKSSFDFSSKHPTSGIKDLLISIENGSYFRTYGIENFNTNNDYYSWYLEILGDEFYDNVQKLFGTLNILIFKLDNIDEKTFFDFLSDFYIGLFPPVIRKLLGEFYTPQWFAEFLVSDSDFTGNFDQSLLDPSCGSGTFLLEFIRKIFLNPKSKAISSENLINKISSNLLAFDINPLAILTTKTNFLLYIYLTRPLVKKLFIPVYEINIVDLDAIKEYKHKFRQFDFIIGNPPWINWEYLTDDRKKRIMDVWENYGLFAHSGWISKLGYAKYDISSLFVYIYTDIFLKEGGTLEFIVPQTLFRGIPGKGFRKFHIPKSMIDNLPHSFNVLKILDFQSFQPFPYVSNNVSVIKLVKVGKTEFPISYYRVRLDQDYNSSATLDQLKENLKSDHFHAYPIISRDLTSRFLILNTNDNFNHFKKLFSKGTYSARLGANTEGLNFVFWIMNLYQGIEKNLLQFEHYNSRLKKKLLVNKKMEIEKEIVYPLLRTMNIKKWFFDINTYIIFTSKGDASIKNEEVFKTNFPSTWEYLKINFEESLLLRKSYAKKSANLPFYIIYGFKSMKSPFKVCWSRMASEINAVVVLPYNDFLIGIKPPIPQETIAYVDLESEEEAYYFCAIVNSEIFTLIVSLFSVKGTKGFGSTNILDSINIPKYDAANLLHKELVDLSKKAHEHSKNKSILQQLEKQINQISIQCLTRNIPESQISSLLLNFNGR